MYLTESEGDDRESKNGAVSEIKCTEVEDGGIKKWNCVNFYIYNM